MTRIRITPEQVGEVASTFKQKSSESQLMISQLDAQIKSLQDSWEEVTQMMFYSDYQHWRSEMQQSTLLLMGISWQLELLSTPIGAIEVHMDR